MSNWVERGSNVAVPAACSRGACACVRQDAAGPIANFQLRITAGNDTLNDRKKLSSDFNEASDAFIDAGLGALQASEIPLDRLGPNARIRSP